MLDTSRGSAENQVGLLASARVNSETNDLHVSIGKPQSYTVYIYLYKIWNIYIYIDRSNIMIHIYIMICILLLTIYSIYICISCIDISMYICVYTYMFLNISYWRNTYPLIHPKQSPWHIIKAPDRPHNRVLGHLPGKNHRGKSLSDGMIKK